MATAVHTEITDRVAVLTLSHPERRNAMNIELSGKLVDAVRAAVADDGVGAIVITGEDPAFCAGGDLAELARADPATLHTVYAGFLAIAQCPLPTIAAVNGAAVGAGLNLALACDLRLAGPRAKFDARFLSLGLHPGGGYTWMLQRLLGPQAAAALTLFGDVLDARRGGPDRAGAPGRRGGRAGRGRAGRPGRRRTPRPGRRDQGDHAADRRGGVARRGGRDRGAGAGGVGAFGAVPGAVGRVAGEDPGCPVARRGAFG